jgi:hypothetical protein
MPRISLCCITSASSKSQGDEAAHTAPRKISHPTTKSKVMDSDSKLHHMNMPSINIHSQPPPHSVCHSGNTEALYIPICPPSLDSNFVDPTLQPNYLHPYYRSTAHIYPAKKIFINTLPTLPEVNEVIESKK